MSEHNLSEVIRHLKADMQVRAAENSRFEFLVLDILAWLLCEGVHNRQFKITDIHRYFNELENDNPKITMIWNTLPASLPVILI